MNGNEFCFSHNLSLKSIPENTLRVYPVKRGNGQNFPFISFDHAGSCFIIFG